MDQIFSLIETRGTIGAVPLFPHLTPVNALLTDHLAWRFPLRLELSDFVSEVVVLLLEFECFALDLAEQVLEIENRLLRF